MWKKDESRYHVLNCNNRDDISFHSCGLHKVFEDYSIDSKSLHSSYLRGGLWKLVQGVIRFMLSHSQRYQKFFVLDVTQLKPETVSEEFLPHFVEEIVDEIVENSQVEKWKIFVLTTCTKVKCLRPEHHQSVGKENFICFEGFDVNETAAMICKVCTGIEEHTAKSYAVTITETYGITSPCAIRLMVKRMGSCPEVIKFAYYLCTSNSRFVLTTKGSLVKN